MFPLKCRPFVEKRVYYTGKNVVDQNSSILKTSSSVFLADDLELFFAKYEESLPRNNICIFFFFFEETTMYNVFESGFELSMGN